MGDHMKRDATFQEIADMKYLDMVLKETLRLYPSVPMVGRHTEKEYNMSRDFFFQKQGFQKNKLNNFPSVDGKLIPEDTSLNIFIMSLGYNEHNFPDPYRFDPERFADSAEVHKPFELVPFSAGLRNCIGQKFAQLEIKTVISKIIRNFQILPAIDELASQDGYVSNILGPSREEQRSKLHKYEPKLEMVLTLKSENGIMVRMRERN